MLTGASRFNIKPKEGIQFFFENGLIPQDDEDDASKARSLARFLKRCPRLDKKLLGDFLSRPDNCDVLDAFIRLFDFREVGLLS
jgi:golgi-specific brefeldin A-resistance guanine nucleotide exchange factor 1